jgi:hypothetical protein
MARKYSFNTFRIVCLRDDDVMDDDVFIVDIMVDGKSTKDLPYEKKAEAAGFLFDMFKKLNNESLKRYEENHAYKGQRDGDL